MTTIVADSAESSIIPDPDAIAPKPGNGALTNGAAAASSSVPGDSTASNRQAAPRALKLRSQRRYRARLRHLLPAWSVSLVVHVVILSALAAATFSNQDTIKKVISFDSALAGYRQGEREEMNIWADPANMPREEAVGKEHGGASADPVLEMAGESEGDEGGGGIVASAFGGGAPSATPRFRGTGKRGINEGNSLPNFKIEGLGGSPLSMLPAAPAADLYGGGKIAGDPVFDVQEIGVALDQLAREILRYMPDVSFFRFQLGASGYWEWMHDPNLIAPASGFHPWDAMAPAALSGISEPKT